MLGVNLNGFFYGARAALPHLVKTRGNMVVTASIAALGATAGGIELVVPVHLLHQQRGRGAQAAAVDAAQGQQMRRAPAGLATPVSGPRRPSELVRKRWSAV